MPPTKEISEVLKALREKNNWSQEDLARELGVSFATVNRWENGKTKPSKLAPKSILALITQSENNRRADNEGNQ